MGSHLDFLYFFLTFSVGMAAMAVVLVAYFRTGTPFLGRYLFFLFSFTLVVTSRMFLAYIKTNLPGMGEPALTVFEYLESFIAKYLFMFALPFFTHALFPFPRSRNVNFLFALLILTTFIGQHFTEFSPYYRLDLYGDLLERWVMTMVIVYCLVIAIVYYRAVTLEPQRSIARIFLILGLFLPAIFVDVFVDRFPFRFYPLLYLVMNVTVVYHLVKLPFSRPATSREPNQDLFMKFGISSREADVIRLVLQGQSNLEVGNTLHISLSTVKSHIRNIFQKCGIKSRYELITMFRQERHGPEKS